MRGRKKNCILRRVPAARIAAEKKETRLLDWEAARDRSSESKIKQKVQGHAPVRKVHRKNRTSARNGRRSGSGQIESCKSEIFIRRNLDQFAI